MIAGPPGGEYEEEYPPVDSGFYSVYAPDDYDYSEYDDEWGTFRPDDGSWDIEHYRNRMPDFDCHYDLQQHRWVCDCAQFLRDDHCKHSYSYRGMVNVPVSEEYL